ncbi:MAG: hypothetical protein BGP24_12485 [Lysobacterales bacterium 69-70]|nr:MAG: hypothetical protein ABT27_06445 [Xanthomonadaceae bacterium SCN 69-25]OJY98603.1 MAG: hypothetical protein BGP24_12485 [Xanthomonadales bacterium 69-70]
MTRLFAACEQHCVAGGCGIGAYDFSPLYIAANLAGYSGKGLQIDGADALYRELDSMLEQGLAQTPNEQGFVCEVAGTNQYFTRELPRTLVERVRWAIAQSLLVVEYVNRLDEHSPPQPID